MSVTPNFSWPLIENTDFVTNLPADLEALADDIDADVWAIKGTADAALPETIIDAAGDLIYGSAADTAARLPIGTAGQVLTVNSGATAPQWKTLSSSTANYTLLNSGGTTLSGSNIITVSGISGITKLLIILDGVNFANAGASCGVRLNTATTDYRVNGGEFNPSSSYSRSDLQNFGSTGFTTINLGRAGAIGEQATNYLYVDGCNSTNPKIFHGMGAGSSGGGNHGARWVGGVYSGTSTISSVSAVSSSGNFSGGTMFIYGSAA